MTQTTRVSCVAVLGVSSCGNSSRMIMSQLLTHLIRGLIEKACAGGSTNCGRKKEDHMSLLPQADANLTAGPAFDLAKKRVLVAGHTGMAGSAIVRRLRSEPCAVLTIDHSELDFERQDETERHFSSRRPDVVIMAAGRVGGILANSKYPASFLADNLAMATQLHTC